MLSSQTKDEQNFKCMVRLREHGLTIENILNTTDIDLKNLLYGVGFHNNKAKYIREACQTLKADYNCDVPNTYEGLIGLPGVGPKMAILVLQVAWGKIDSGICVDVHVHRICNRLEWVKTWNHKTKSQDPEKTRKALEAWLPVQLWGEINPMLVGFGQNICTPIKPKCIECSVSALCPSRKRNGAIPK
jgi:endonuclease-3